MKTPTTSDVIFDLVQSYRTAMKQEIKASQLGINGMHIKCLSIINMTNHCTANDMVKSLSRDKAQIARVVKEMLTNNWVEKKTNIQDKRSQILVLTNEGLSLLKQVQKAQAKIQTQMQLDLTQQELDTFLHTSQKLIHNLSQLSDQD